MKKNTARKLSDIDSDQSSSSSRPAQLFVRKEENQGLAEEAVYVSKRFRGDLLVYFIAIGIWLFGTVWMVVKLIDKFF
jgi:hypothetical protein